MYQARTCGRVLAQDRVQVLQQCKSDGRVKIYNFVSARSPLTKSKKEKINREHSNIKSAGVSALTGSVPLKMAKGRGKGIQHPAGIEPMSHETLQPVLTTKP